VVSNMLSMFKHLSVRLLQTTCDVLQFWLQHKCCTEASETLGLSPDVGWIPLGDRFGCPPTSANLCQALGGIPMHWALWGATGGAFGLVKWHYWHSSCRGQTAKRSANIWTICDQQSW
jgi:hypothetical protein